MDHLFSKSLAHVVLTLLMTASPCFEVKASHMNQIEEIDGFPKARGKKRTHDVDSSELTSLVEYVFDNHADMLSIKKILSELNDDNSEQAALISQYAEKLGNLEGEEKKLRERWAELNVDAGLWDVVVGEEDRSVAIACFLSLYQDSGEKKGSFVQPKKLLKNEEKEIPLSPLHSAYQSELDTTLDQSRLEALEKLHQNGITLLPEDQHDLDLIEAYLGSVAEENKKIREEQDRDYQKSLHRDQLKILHKKLGVLTDDLEILRNKKMKLHEPIDEKKSAIVALETEIENHQSRMQRFGHNPKLEQDVKANEEKIKAIKEEISKIEQENSEVVSKVHSAVEEQEAEMKKAKKDIEELESLVSYESSETKTSQ